MNKSEPNKTYFVMLARPVVQNTLVAVQAGSHEDAIARALERAPLFPPRRGRAGSRSNAMHTT